MDRKSLPLLIMMSVAALLPTSVMAAASAVNTLPGVENETTSSSVPVLSPDLVQRNGVAVSATEPAVTEPAKPAFEFKSQEEARDKIRRAYLLQKNEELLKLSQAALAQWPDDASFDYYREIAETRIKTAGESDANEPAYKKLREKRRKDAIRAILNETTATPGVAAAPATQTPALKTAQTPAPAKTQQTASQTRPRPQIEPAEPAPARASAIDKLKEQLLQPIVLYCLGGIVVLGAIVVVLLRRKGGIAKAEPQDKIKLKAESRKAEPKPAEPKPEPAMFNAADELDSLFKPAAAGPAKPVPEPAPTSESADLDALFGSIAEQPTAASKPVPEPEPEPEPDVIHEETVPVMTGPIRLDDAPIELPSVEEVPPIVTPVTIPELNMPALAAVEPEPEIVPPISLTLPDEDPFYTGGHDEPRPISLNEDTSDLLSVVDQPTAVSDPNAGFRPIMPEILEEPAIQPELASTHGFGDDTTTGLPPTDEDREDQTIALPEDGEETVISAQGAVDDETATAELDLPTIDTTPSVSVHSDETIALDEDTREIVQETAVSPEIPEPVAVSADGKGGAGEDLFSREYRRGMSDFAGSNWAGAVHHLSIAAALKPASAEVKERLREARRRRKESEGE
ncbi:hypothetical protein LLG95_17520 [bacterium]|nr:hypothetical protein [bacterium]